MENIRKIGVITIIIGFILLIVGFVCDMNTYKKLPNEKPISYPEEIQAVRAGDTLYVYSVSDSIYLGFKNN